MIIIALLLFGVFVAYTYIGFQTSKFHYASDFTYVLFKFRILLGTVAMGYFAAILSNFYSSFPFIGTYLDAFTGVVSVGFVRNLLALISTIWITFALAMLPFNHTVFNVEDDSINEERTKKHTKSAPRNTHTLFMYDLQRDGNPVLRASIPGFLKMDKMLLPLLLL